MGPTDKNFWPGIWLGMEPDWPKIALWHPASIVWADATWMQFSPTTRGNIKVVAKEEGAVEVVVATFTTLAIETAKAIDADAVVKVVAAVMAGETIKTIVVAKTTPLMAIKAPLVERVVIKKVSNYVRI